MYWAVRDDGPVYRVLPAVDGHWYVLGYPWLSIGAEDRRSAVATTRAAVAEWLDVETETFDVEAG